MKKGSLSINSENIFPVIKKWLYSDHDIFVRELISNGCDAVTKLKKLSLMGEFDEPDEPYRIDVIASPDNKTLQFIDNGIGMTAEEVEKYINQIAFSGAAAFLEQYKDKATEEQIIGHFGLGFYSAFMVADKVTIESLSYKQDAEPVYWECENGTDFSMDKGDKETRGTVITLYLNEDSYEFANEYRIKEVIDKYCSFMPVEIYFTNADAPAKDEEEKATEAEASEEATAETDETKDAAEKKEKEAPKPLNTTTPLWTKHPNDCTDDEYKDFYHKVFHDYKDPLFWIHLNMDYPFNLKGILYFPRINTEYDSIEGTIKLYNNQVFIADNIKEVIPEYLMLLKGVIDCPDLPLNVSRSALQNDGFVKKISEYISKKFADKLSGMCKTDRENYEKYWDDINPFIKYGCIKDEKFSKKMMDYILFKNIDGKYLTLEDCINENKKEEAPAESTEEKAETTENTENTENADEKKEPEKTTVYYVTDEVQQSQYINMFRSQGMDAVILKHNIDSAFITHAERYNEHVTFQRIDADLTNDMKDESGEDLTDATNTLTDLFRKVLDKKDLTVKVENLKDENVSSMVTLSEESRRMQDMMKMYGMTGMDPSMFGGQETLILNAKHPLVQYILKNGENDNTSLFCEQLYDLAMISHKPLSPDEMTKFVSRSNQIMMLLAK